MHVNKVVAAPVAVNACLQHVKFSKMKLAIHRRMNGRWTALLTRRGGKTTRKNLLNTTKTLASKNYDLVNT